MFPLLTKDGHRTTYVSTLAIYSCMVAAYCNIIPAAPALVRTGYIDLMLMILIIQ